ncbi:MAG: hypothetical protein HY284_03385 [Nitrospirae bacterium]|nr:hypothetical protein [Nitrospirota bacterium]
MPRFNHKAIWAMVVLQQVLGFVWPVVARDRRGRGQGTRRRHPHGRHPRGVEEIAHS